METGRKPEERSSERNNRRPANCKTRNRNSARNNGKGNAGGQSEKTGTQVQVRLQVNGSTYGCRQSPLHIWKIDSAAESIALQEVITENRNCQPEEP